MGQRVVSAFQAQFVPQCVNFFRLCLDPVGGFCQIIAQRTIVRRCFESVCCGLLPLYSVAVMQ